MSSTCRSTSKMALRGAIVVSLLICFTSATPTRQFGDPVLGQTDNLPKNPLAPFPEAPLQSKEVIQDPAKSEASQDMASPQKLQADTESDLSRLPAAPREGSTLDVNGNEAGLHIPADVMAADQGFSNEFVKKVLRGFFDELKKRPDLVEQILRYETLKELTRPRPEPMLLPPDVITANLQELPPQPVQEASKLDTMTHSETTGQTQAQTQQAPAFAQTNAQNQQILSQPSDVSNEAVSKKDNSGGNSTGTGSQDQMADGKAQMETPKGKGDIDMPTAPLQDPFYYYFYYPDDEMATGTDTFLDSPTLTNDNNGGTPSPEDAVIDKLAKSVLAVIQYGLESNNNNININDINKVSTGSGNNNNINDNTNKNNISKDKGDNAQTPSVTQEENQEVKTGTKNIAEAGSTDTLNEEDQLSRLAGHSGD